MKKSVLVLSVCGVLALLGLASISGNPSSFDKLLARCSTAQIAIVLSVCVAFWCCVILQVWRAMAAWIKAEAAGQAKAANKLAGGQTSLLCALFLSLSLLPQPARAWTRLPVENPIVSNSIQIEQPFTLTPDEQRQVDAAIAGATKDASDNPGFTTTIELAIGIFIAAVIVGTTLYIIVRKVCKGLDRMKASLTNRLGNVKDFLIHPQGTNQPVMLGAALFMDGPATTDDLPIGQELLIGFKAQPEPVTLNSNLANTETVTLEQFIAPFGLTDKLPQDSVAGTAITRTGNGGYKVLEGGVTLSIESCNGLQNAWKRAVALSVPAGAVLDVSDLTGASEGRFWRVVTTP